MDVESWLSSENVLDSSFGSVDTEYLISAHPDQSLSPDVTADNLYRDETVHKQFNSNSDYNYFDRSQIQTGFSYVPKSLRSPTRVLPVEKYVPKTIYSPESPSKIQTYSPKQQRDAYSVQDRSSHIPSSQYRTPEKVSNISIEKVHASLPAEQSPKRVLFPHTSSGHASSDYHHMNVSRDRAEALQGKTNAPPATVGPLEKSVDNSIRSLPSYSFEGKRLFL